VGIATISPSCPQLWLGATQLALSHVYPPDEPTLVNLEVFKVLVTYRVWPISSPTATMPSSHRDLYWPGVYPHTLEWAKAEYSICFS